MTSDRRRRLLEALDRSQSANSILKTQYYAMYDQAGKQVDLDAFSVVAMIGTRTAMAVGPAVEISEPLNAILGDLLR